MKRVKRALAIGKRYQNAPDAEGVEQNNVQLLLAVSERLNFASVPSDARWAIMFVAVGDVKRENIFIQLQKIVVISIKLH